MKYLLANYHMKFLLFIVLPLLVLGCVEPMEVETGNYTDALVVEATITSDLDFQEVLLSRTFELTESGPSKERNAQVRVVGNDIAYNFRETEPGKYVSLQAFRAEQGVSYRLEITTSNGNEYSSEPEELPQSSGISSLYAQKESFGGTNGIAILVDVTAPMETSGFFQFEFEETYKIVSPYSYDFDLRVIDGEFEEIPKTTEETVCYATELSNEVILTNTNLQTGNDLEAFLIKFMEREDFRTAYRYSILVRQYSISAEAYSYFKTLQDFSESENLFSQNQLGFINGNIFSVTNPDEPVIGIFSVAGVSSERIFFDFEDFYSPGEFLPNSHVNCEVLFPPVQTVAQRNAIGEQLQIGDIKYLGYEVAMPSNIYRFARKECVDCTVFGRNTPPDFWEE